MSEIKEIPEIPLPIILLMLMLFPQENELGLVMESISAKINSSYILDLAKDHYIKVDPEISEMIQNSLTLQQVDALVNSNLSFVHGNISGMMVTFILSAATCPDTRRFANVSTAARCIHHIHRRERGLSVANIQVNIWPKFRPVASLWAAHHLWYIQDAERATKVFSWKENDAALLLCRAMKIQELGQKFKPAHSATTLLPRTSLLGRYRAVAGSAVEFKYGRLPEELIEIASGR